MKRIICMLTTMALILCLAGCAECDIFEVPEVVKEEELSWSEEIAYAYYSAEAETNSYGGVEDYDYYLNIGIIKGSGAVERKQYSDYNVPDIYAGDSNQIVHHFIKRTYDDGSEHSENTYDVIILTAEMLRDIGKGKN